MVTPVDPGSYVICSLISVQMPSLDHKEDDADQDDEDRAHDGSATQAAHLVAILIALSAGLIAQDAALILQILGSRRAIRRAWRRWVGWRIAGHGYFPSSSCGVTGTEVAAGGTGA